MTGILELVEAHLHQTGTAVTSFGRKAVGDPRFVLDLRNGRKPSRRVQERVRRYLVDRVPHVPSGPNRAWLKGYDEHLWAMVQQGIDRVQIAYAFDASITAIHNKINRLAEERLPDRPRYARLEDVIFNASRQAHASGPSL